MRKRKLLAGLMVLALPLLGLHAGIEGGEREFGGTFSLLKPSEGDPFWFAQATYGIFTSEIIRWSGQAFLFGSSGDTSGAVGVGIDRLFPEKGGPDLIPYLGGAVNASIGDYTDDSLLLDLHAGVKQFFKENISLNFEAKYLFTTSEMGDGLISLTVGLSYYF